MDNRKYLKHNYFHQIIKSINLFSSMQFPASYGEYHYDINHREQSKTERQRRRPRQQLVYLVRHAEAAHNIVEKQALRDAIANGILEKEAQEKARRAVLNQESLRDAPLSQEGQLQVMRKSRSLTMLNTLGGEKYAPPKIVLVSPLRRALMTATELFSPKVDNTRPLPKFVALEVLREKRTGFAADERRSVDILEREFPHVDFADLKRSDRLRVEIGENNDSVRDRARLFLEGPLADMVDTTAVAIVTHKGWLRELRRTLKADVMKGDLLVNFDLDDWDTTLFKNAEVRVAEFGWEGRKLTTIVSKSVDTAISSVMGSAVLKRSERSMQELWGGSAGEKILDLHAKGLERTTCFPCKTLQRWLASF
eukprot:scaffold4501_cov118-Cylindrotheca_fusiformis.AAC.4